MDRRRGPPALAARAAQDHSSTDNIGNRSIRSGTRERKREADSPSVRQREPSRSLNLKTCEKSPAREQAKTSKKALFNGLCAHSSDHKAQLPRSLYSKPYISHAASDAGYTHDDAQKPNTHIRVSQALRIIECAGYAFCIGMPLNRFLTIDLPASLSSDLLKPTLGAFLKYASDWLRIATRSPPYYVWSLENKKWDHPRPHTHPCAASSAPRLP